MNLYDIQKELSAICDDLIKASNRLCKLFLTVKEEIARQETVELRLITKKRRGRSAFTPLKPYSSGIEKKPTLYNRMIESGYTLEEIKKLFGEKSHIKAKISFGSERFTDIEAEKLTELFHLSEQERGVYFWRGIIDTTPR